MKWDAAGVVAGMLVLNAVLLVGVAVFVPRSASQPPGTFLLYLDAEILKARERERQAKADYEVEAERWTRYAAAGEKAQADDWLLNQVVPARQQWYVAEAEAARLDAVRDAYEKRMGAK